MTPLQILVLLVVPRFKGARASALKILRRLPDEFLINGPLDVSLIEQGLSSLAEAGLVDEKRDFWARTAAGEAKVAKLRASFTLQGQLPGDEYRSASAFLRVAGVEFSDDELGRYVVMLGFTCLVQMLPILANRRADGQGPKLADLVADFVKL